MLINGRLVLVYWLSGTGRRDRAERLAVLVVDAADKMTNEISSLKNRRAAEYAGMIKSHLQWGAVLSRQQFPRWGGLWTTASM